MQFVKSEIEGVERMNLAIDGFGLMMIEIIEKRGVTQTLPRIYCQPLLY